MDNRAEVRDFLKSRRDKITPEQAGLPSYGPRRVAGLRRSEVAMLAGVSVEYYTRVERGSLSGVSDGVLDSLARALRLDDTERGHLFDLARAANVTPARARRQPSRSAVRPGVQRLIDAMGAIPAHVLNNRFDVLAANPLSRALFSEMYADRACGANLARFVFLSPVARRFYPEWDRIADGAVGSLRVEAGRDPHDRELSNLIGELSTRSDTFRILWGAHDVHVFREGVKRFRHPDVGELELDHEALELRGDDGLIIATYTAPPGTPADDRLKLLASWSVTGQGTPATAADPEA